MATSSVWVNVPLASLVKQDSWHAINRHVSWIKPLCSSARRTASVSFFAKFTLGLCSDVGQCSSNTRQQAHCHARWKHTY